MEKDKFNWQRWLWAQKLTRSMWGQQRWYTIYESLESNVPLGHMQTAEGFYGAYLLAYKGFKRDIILVDAISGERL